MGTDSLSRTRFVIRPGGGASIADESVREALGDLGAVVPLEGCEPGWLLTLKKASEAARPCPRVARRLDGAVAVVPVVEASGDGPRYPTGLVNVRFREPVTDEELDAFGRATRTAPVARSTFSAKQVTLRVDAPADTYLPDAVRAIGRRDDVELAWLDTESSYTKAAAPRTPRAARKPPPRKE
ncbi:MAG: hypothetical protein U0575_09080 [Phycisphaerales bacterium]